MKILKVMHNNYFMFKASYFNKAFMALLVLATVKGYAQFDNKTAALLPSPNSLSVLRHTNTPVNLYAGIPFISADLHNLQARGFSIPISLNYLASGVKVQDVASTVGINWSLNVNSLITRVVKGLPDEDASGYFGGNSISQIESSLNKELIERIIKNDFDAEPDVFYFNINGLSGKFVFDRNKNPVYLNSNSIRVINSPFKKEIGLEGWLLEDLSGNKYYLGENSSCTESSKVELNVESGLPITKTFIATWFLSKIVTVNNIETINYSYIEGTETKSESYIKNRKKVFKYVRTYTPPKTVSFIFRFTIKESSVTESQTTIESSEWNGDIITTTINPKYLSSITSSDENALFTYSEHGERHDLQWGRILQKIEITNFKSTAVKSFSLNHNYLNSYNDGRLTDEKGLRLALTSIILKDKITANQQKVFAFTYNNIRLPLRNSEKTDHWGYYSSYGDTFQPEGARYIANFKKADPQLMPAGSLSRITYATGGFKDFYYECNQYYDPYGTQEKNAGGLRISSIRNAVQENDPYPQVTSYIYKKDDGSNISSGTCIKTQSAYVRNIDHLQSFNAAARIGSGSIVPISGSTGGPVAIVDNVVPHPTNVSQIAVNGSRKAEVTASVIAGIYASYNSYMAPITTTIYSPFYIESSVSYSEKFDSDGTIVGYSTVTETSNNNAGYTVNKFTDVYDYPDSCIQFRVKENGEPIKDSSIPYQNPPYTPATSYYLARGALKEQIVYNNNNIAVKRITNKYALHSFGQKIIGIRFSEGQLNKHMANNELFQRSPYYNCGNYYILPKTLLLTETEETNYFPNAVTTKTQYQYDPNFPALVKSEKTTSSNGEVIENQYKYAVNKSEVSYSNPLETTAANTLYDNRAFGVLLEKSNTVTRKDGVQAVKKERTGFKNWTVNNKAFTLPETVYSGQGSTLKARMTFYTYDQFGNLVSSAAKGAPKNTIILDHNALYPVAEIQNAGADEIFFEDFEYLNPPAASGYLSNRSYSGDYMVNFTVPNNKAYTISYYYYSSGWIFSGSKPYTGPMLLSEGEHIDKVIIAPAGAFISSSKAYDDSGNLTRSTDAKGLSTYYQYDSFNRLEYILDDQKTIRKKYEYNFKP